MRTSMLARLLLTSALYELLVERPAEHDLNGCRQQEFDPPEFDAEDRLRENSPPSRNFSARKTASGPTVWLE